MMGDYDPYGRYPGDGYGNGDAETSGYDDYDDEPYTEPSEEPIEEPEAFFQAPYESYEQPYEEPYQEPYDAPYEEPAPPPPPRKASVISNNATINLTCTLCASCGPLALFLYFAEQRNRVIRRCAVQSAGLFCVAAFLSILLGVLGLLLGWIPFIGGVLRALLWLLWLGMLVWDVIQRVRLMLHAYRGQAYALPIIGKQCRQFE